MDVSLSPSAKTHGAGSSVHLLSRPQSLGFDDGRRQQLDSALFVRQSSVHQLGVLDSVEEAASYGHPGARHHVVLDQPGQRFAILKTQEFYFSVFFSFNRELKASYASEW